MYKKIVAAIDNSVHSDAAAEAAASLARAFGSALTGIHVYAARLHERRFALMEGALPSRYREGGELERQRAVHSTLIEKGLTIISNSYLDRFSSLCASRGVGCEVRAVEGRNHSTLLAEIASRGSELVVMGAVGLGEVEGERIGSVAARVLRRAPCDVLIARGADTLEGPVVVAVDSSPWSLRAVDVACALAKAFGVKVEAVAVYDPFYHRAAFANISAALSADASQLFRFDEQRELHDEIIDRGMARVYTDCLDAARARGRVNGVEMNARLLTGKPHRAVAERAVEAGATLIVAGRHGIHRADGALIGSTAENIASSAPCSVLITSAEAAPQEGDATA